MFREVKGAQVGAFGDADPDADGRGVPVDSPSLEPFGQARTDQGTDHAVPDVDVRGAARTKECPTANCGGERARHDGTAFGGLFERHADAVYLHCFRRTASWSTAGGTDECRLFLEAWRRRRAVRLDTDSILPWLLAVANNAIRNARPATAPSPAPSGQAAPCCSMRMTLGMTLLTG